MKLSDMPATAAASNPVSPATLRQYRAAARKLAAFTGDVPTSQLTATAVAEFCAMLVDQDIRTTAANHYRRTLKAMFNRIQRPDLAKALTLRNEPQRRDKAMSDEDLQKCLSYAHLRDAAIISLLAESGCRRSTVATLRQEDMIIWQSTNGEFRFAAETTEKGQKGGEPRIIFAGERTALAVTLWLKIRPYPSAYVFNSLTDGQPLEPQAVTRMMHKLKQVAGIPRAHNVFAHALRHRFAQKMLNDHDVKIVSQWMGHKSASTTLDIYGTRSIEDLATAFFGDSDNRLPE